MEFEEYIKKTAKDEKDIAHISCSVARGFYPFTKQCPVSGRCRYEDCDKYLDGKCFEFEVDRIFYEVLGEGPTSHRYTEVSTEHGWLTWDISQSNYYPEEVGGKERVGYRFGTENGNISWRVVREIGMENYFKPDEYPPTVFFTKEFSNLPAIREFLEKIKERFDEITEKFKKYHTCMRCDRVSHYINVYHELYGICEKCQSELAEHWIEKQAVLDYALEAEDYPTVEETMEHFEGAEWAHAALTELESEMSVIIHPDGNKIVVTAITNPKLQKLVDESRSAKEVV